MNGVWQASTDTKQNKQTNEKSNETTPRRQCQSIAHTHIALACFPNQLDFHMLYLFFPASFTFKLWYFCCREKIYDFYSDFIVGVCVAAKTDVCRWLWSSNHIHKIIITIMIIISGDTLSIIIMMQCHGFRRTDRVKRGVNSGVYLSPAKCTQSSNCCNAPPLASFCFWLNRLGSVFPSYDSQWHLAMRIGEFGPVSN